MTKATYLAAYALWVQHGRPGRAPSAQAHGVDACDHTLDLCAIDEADRLASGLSSWQFYDPAHHKPLMAERRKAAGYDDTGSP